MYFEPVSPLLEWAMRALVANQWLVNGMALFKVLKSSDAKSQKSQFAKACCWPHDPRVQT